jgi:GNAT superfamily N-acetyltransferase
MLVPAKLNPLPGLALAALPSASVLGFGLAFLSLMGGQAQVWRMVDTAGSYSLLMVATVVGVTLLLSGLLCMGLTGRHAPLVVLVGLGMLPWFLGIAGTEEAVEKMLAALPAAGSGELLSALMTGTGEAMVARLLGAWASAGLLVGMAVGITLLRKQAALMGEDAGRLLGAALSLVLGGVALLVALEAAQLFELLTSVSTQSDEAHAGLIAAGTQRLLQLQTLRSAILGALGVLALALVCWQLFIRPEAVGQWVGSMMLAALAATVLMLDGRPLRLAAHMAQEAGLPRDVLSMLAPTDTSLGLAATPPARLQLPSAHVPAP